MFDFDFIKKQGEAVVNSLFLEFLELLLSWKVEHLITLILF